MTSPAPQPLDRPEPSLHDLYEAADDMADWAMEHYIELHRHQPEDKQ